jgi:hypothetical protein
MSLIFVTQGHLCQHVVTLSIGTRSEESSPNPEKGDFVPSPKLTRKKVTFVLLDKLQTGKGGLLAAH